MITPRQETLLHAYKYVLSEMKKQGTLNSDFLQRLSCVRCKFFLLEDDKAFEQKKWELDEGQGVMADERTLIGFNLVLGIARIRDSLSGPGVEASPQEVSAWLKTAKVKDMSAKVVGVYLRIRTRFPPEAVVHQLQFNLISQSCCRCLIWIIRSSLGSWIQ